DIVQPVLFAMMVSLAALWQSYGVEPDAVIGHSQGEIAAACIAGALSLEDAAKIVTLRSKVLTALAGAGAMAAGERSRSELGADIERYGERIAVAVDNGPATVVSGQPAAVDELIAEFQARGVFARRVNVDYASHCAQIDAIREPLLQALVGIAPKQG